MDDIRYIERSTGELCTEKVYGHRALSLIYGNSLFSRLFALVFLPLISRVPLISYLYGLMQKSASSRKKIEPFIQSYEVDASEFAEPVSSFRSFNEFFIRKLKPECRPIDPDPNVAVLPADGRYLVFPQIRRAEGFYVKGQEFDLCSFLHEETLGRRYADGSMAIVRLCPTDYHRFHFPVRGTASAVRPIPGPLYSVNPMALAKRLPILWENKRVITEIESENFGTVAMVEIGATCVGTIHQTYLPGFVEKGDEKGYFSFGGSCVVLLFERNRIEFQQDLIENSSRYLETRGLFGTPLGRKMP